MSLTFSKNLSGVPVYGTVTAHCTNTGCKNVFSYMGLPAQAPEELRAAGWSANGRCKTCKDSQNSGLMAAIHNVSGRS